MVNRGKAESESYWTSERAYEAQAAKESGLGDALYEISYVDLRSGFHLLSYHNSPCLVLGLHMDMFRWAQKKDRHRSFSLSLDWNRHSPFRRAKGSTHFVKDSVATRIKDPSRPWVRPMTSKPHISKGLPSLPTRFRLHFISSLYLSGRSSLIVWVRLHGSIFH